jgi:predicted DCC family thiol-disulfide oxidoreductase YuxK
VSAAGEVWRRFWFEPVAVRRLAALRLILVGYVLFDLLADPVGNRPLGRVGEPFWNPDALVLTRELHLPRTPDELWTPLWCALLVLASLAFVGLATRLALWLLAVGYAWWVLMFLAHSTIGHGRLPLVVALFALAIGPAGRALALDAVIARVRRARAGARLPEPTDERDELAGWAIRFIGIALVLVYLSAGVAKLRNAGFDWAFDGALDAALVEQGTSLGRFLADYPSLVHILALSAFVWELTAWAVLLGGRLRDAWCLFGVFFHVGSLVLLEVNFLDYVVLYAAFYRLEDGLGWARVRAHGWSASRLAKIEVAYDGMCLLCLRAVTFIRGLDWLDRLRPYDGSGAGGRRLPLFVVHDAVERHEGFLAYRRIARAVPAFWPLLPLLYLPGVSRLGRRVYAQVAANRATSCRIETRSLPLGATGGSASRVEAGDGRVAG